MEMKPITIEEAFAVYDEAPTGEPTAKVMTTDEAVEVIEQEKSDGVQS